MEGGVGAGDDDRLPSLSLDRTLLSVCLIAVVQLTDGVTRLSSKTMNDWSLSRANSGEAAVSES
jgi:hypothetical protein